MKDCSSQPVELERDFQLLSERSTETATTQAILRGKDSTAQGELDGSFEPGDKQWKITSDGKRNIVVDSASIELNRRARRAKNDRLDGDKLPAMLLRWHGGGRRLWSVLTAPTAEQEDARRVERELDRLLLPSMISVLHRPVESAADSGHGESISSRTAGARVGSEYLVLS